MRRWQQHREHRTNENALFTSFSLFHVRTTTGAFLRIFQYFANKFDNFTKCRMLFLAVVIDLVFFCLDDNLV